MNKREIKHTKFLAFLLDPNESHGLGDSFLFAFLSGFSKNISIPLMMLHTELCEVKPEWKTTAQNNKDKKSIDIYLKIPKHGTANESLHIFIENKIKSRENVDNNGNYQLTTYSKMVNEWAVKNNVHVGNIKKIFLTERGEDEVSDQEWQKITYGNEVIYAINQIFELKNNTLSNYIKQVLLDYKLLIDGDDEFDIQIEKIARNVNGEYIDWIRKNKGSNNEAISINEQWQRNNFFIRYSKACNYLSRYDSDLRSDFLNEWNKIKPSTIDIRGKNYEFNIQTSSRTFFRFSVLTKSNIENIQKISNNPQKEWLESKINLAFEIGLKPLEGKNEEFYTWATLVLGPLNASEDRKSLVNKLAASFDANDKKVITPYYTRIIPAKKLIPTALRNIDKVKDEINKLLFHCYSNGVLNQNPIKLTNEFEKIVEKLNSSLEDYFLLLNQE